MARPKKTEEAVAEVVEVKEEKKTTTKKVTSTKSTTKKSEPAKAEEVKEEQPAAVTEKKAKVKKETKKVEPPKEEVKEVEAKPAVAGNSTFTVQIVASNGVYTFKGPGLDQPKGKILSNGIKVDIIEVKGNWGKISEGKWILLGSTAVKV